MTINENGKNEQNSQFGLCLICYKPVIYKYRPFCSQRCATIDLWGWMNEEHSIDSANLEKEVSKDFPDEQEPN